MLSYAPHQPLLSLSYEEMLGEHAASIRRLAAFLGLPAADASAPATRGGSGSLSGGSDGSGGGGGGGSGGGGGGGGGSTGGTAAAPRYSKATPDRLCAAIANYRAVCEAYKGTEHAPHFDEPCDTLCLAPKR